MTLPYRKKLIEVALPLEAINVASAREKSIRHGHPSTLHLWWARRPLAACRAVLFASLVDDPDSDPAFDAYKNPEEREHATGAKRQQLFDLITELVQWDNSNNELVINAARAEIARCVASRKIETGELKKDLKLKGGETVWDLVVKGHGDLEQLRAGKCRLPEAESVNAFLVEHVPPVLDPFCGGGSIPLEAQRLGLRAYGSDLNPVPVLITKALIEIPPKFANMPPVNPESRHEAGHSGKKGNGKGKALIEGGWKGAQGLAEDVRYYGKWMRDEAEKRIGHLYPKVMVTAEMAKDRPDLKPYIGEELTVIAWLWARTVASPNPVVSGAHVPLARSFWLCTKTNKEAWVEPIIDRKNNTYQFRVHKGKPQNKSAVDAGTKIGRGCKFKCLLSDQPIADTHVKQAGSRDELGARLMAIVASGNRGRVYLSPTELHERTASVAKPPNIAAIEAPLAKDPRNLWCLGYGLDRFDKLFTPRQLNALVTFSDLAIEVRVKVISDAKAAGTLPADGRLLDEGGNGVKAYADAVATYLSFGVSRGSDAWSSLTSWRNGVEATRGTFARQAMPMMWDYAEANPFSTACGNWEDAAIQWITRVIETAPATASGGVQQLDATTSLASVPSPIVSTDPPYYDNISYADLSDFFYVWLRRSASTIFPSLFSTLVTPKSQELIASPYRHEGGKDAAHSFFEDGLGKAFDRMRAKHPPEFPMTVYYAFKQAEADEVGDDDDAIVETTASTGWETMLGGLIRARFCIMGTWPVRTERGGRSIGIGTNALASSIVLVCRPRPKDAPLATRREFLNALKRELPDALKHLQRGNIAPVDLAQAAIGPGMAVFTRYEKVMESDGSPMNVRQALALINQSLDEVLAEQEGEFDGDTRWAVAWFEQFGMEEGAFGVAETLSKAKNTAINGLVEAGLIAAKGGKVRLLKRADLPGDWDPATDTRLRHWEIVQHLIRVLETSGESAAADLRRKLGGMGDMARDLAYRLYSICERKKWAQDALAYNGLVIAWPEITKLAQAAGPQGSKESQGAMF